MRRTDSSTMGSHLLLVAVATIITWFPSGLDAQAQPPATDACRPAGPLVNIDGVPEASGVAAGRTHPDRLWVSNDSGHQPELTSLDTRGAVTGRLRLTGATLEDWEALTIGPCPSGSCLYVGDIGDNDAKRRRVTIYRVPEPDSASGTAAAEAIHASYPDGAHDAETLLVAPDGTLHIVTKGDTGPIALYKFPRELNGGAEVKLERVGQPLSAKTDKRGRVTDGAVSPDGQWVVLRTNTHLTFYRSADFFAGQWREAKRVDLSVLAEPQGEAVALAAGNVVFVVGEGGGKKRPGTFARFTCAAGQ